MSDLVLFVRCLVKVGLMTGLIFSLAVAVLTEVLLNQFKKEKSL